MVKAIQSGPSREMNQASIHPSRETPFSYRDPGLTVGEKLQVAQWATKEMLQTVGLGVRDFVSGLPKFVLEDVGCHPQNAVCTLFYSLSYLFGRPVTDATQAARIGAARINTAGSAEEKLEGWGAVIGGVSSGALAFLGPLASPISRAGKGASPVFIPLAQVTRTNGVGALSLSAAGGATLPVESVGVIAAAGPLGATVKLYQGGNNPSGADGSDAVRITGADGKVRHISPKTFEELLAALRKDMDRVIDVFVKGTNITKEPEIIIEFPNRVTLRIRVQRISSSNDASTPVTNYRFVSSRPFQLAQGVELPPFMEEVQNPFRFVVDMELRDTTNIMISLDKIEVLYFDGQLNMLASVREGNYLSQDGYLFEIGTQGKGGGWSLVRLRTDVRYPDCSPLLMVFLEAHREFLGFR